MADEWNGMSRQEDGPRSMADVESAQEYQDDDFSDELGLSDPPHPLFPTSLDSNCTVTHRNWQAGGRSRMSEQRVLTL